MTETELLQRYARGDRSAFDEIVSMHMARVYAVSLRMCGNPDDARDVAQEVFISAMRALKTFRGDAQLSTWFHRVATNASLDHLRKAKRHLSSVLPEDRPSDDPAPDEHAAAAVRAAEVQRALRDISPDHRAVLVLHDIQGMDYGEVASTLELPLGTVKSRLSRARAEMARRLGHLRETEPIEPEPPLRTER